MYCNHLIILFCPDPTPTTTTSTGLFGGINGIPIKEGSLISPTESCRILKKFLEILRDFIKLLTKTLGNRTEIAELAYLSLTNRPDLHFLRKYCDLQQF